ncbi:MAG TPA: multiheme c-type cytochrome, partial [Thermoanaerobaculia bacterium]|nr:multiheme c-type cytochrome [Thermoanaerobaculia bacterium]
MPETPTQLRTGWSSVPTRLAAAALWFEAATGLAITFAPFHAAVEWQLLAHTVLGLALLVPLTWYTAAHWLDYRRYAVSDTVVLGYLAGVALLVCAVSGLVVTWQGIAGPRLSPLWRNVHLVSTFVVLGATAVHLWASWARARSKRAAAPVGAWLAWGALPAAVAVGAVSLLVGVEAGPHTRTAGYRFPDDYNFLYGEDRPFAPSLARTESGGPMAPDTLAHSESCGTAGCHEQILAEWRPSAHRYSAMDTFFQKVQSVMAAQNGPESTRYCGGCHDPISLFSGSKNLFTEELTASLGRDEGVSCLTCHGIRETDVEGNANYVMSAPPTYLWQWHDEGPERVVRDFLIRAYPDEHAKLSKRMFKAPEYCAACHKQFIDQEVNRVGWVQLQNQYDNWKASHWFREGDPQRTVECRECHMPLVASRDPAAGDDADYNRTPGDGMHRSHRFIAANSMMPAMLELEGWQEQVRLTEEWLGGRFEVPEIREKWAQGPVVSVALDVPDEVEPGATVPVRVVLTSNKVGHDFPTGPLDIIQSWVELEVRDPSGAVVFATGRRDERNFIEEGSFLFKAEPVDQYGNLIDRHNLWEMVGVRYRRALFPGYSDAVEYSVQCPATLTPSAAVEGGSRTYSEETREVAVPRSGTGGRYRVTAVLHYRKVDQFLVNFLLGDDSGVTSPAIEMARAVAEFEVREPAASAAP